MTKLSKSQKGFSAIFLLLILVLLAFILFVWWYVLRHRDTAGTPSGDVSLSSAKSEVALPDGYVWYEDSTLDFKFAYPKTWGDVSVTTKDEYKTYHYTEGSLPPTNCPNSMYILSFSGVDSVSASLLNKNCVPGPRGGGAVDIADFCMGDDGSYEFSYRKSETIGGGSDYKATGTLECSTTPISETVNVISSNAILVPSICTGEECIDSSTESMSIMVLHSGLSDYPGFKIIDTSKSHDDELSTIAGTFSVL